MTLCSIQQMFLVPYQRALVAISTGLFGFFGVGAYPIGLELAVEATYPVEESISTAFIFMSGLAIHVLTYSIFVLYNIQHINVRGSIVVAEMVVTDYQ